MSSTFTGLSLRLSIFGQSHSEAIGMTLDGLPAGIAVDTEKLQAFLNRRAPGRNSWSTPRREEDRPEFLSGLKDGKTCGAPITAIIRNTNTRSKDYSLLKVLPRPGHADYTAEVKFNGCQDFAGGGHFSGRLTAPMCIAGGILLQELERRDIRVDARIRAIAGITDLSAFTESVKDKPFPVSDDEKGRLMQQAIKQAREEGDSVGGIVECRITGVKAGIGSPIFDGLENQIARIVFAVPAVIRKATNHAGGILGGISDGMPILFRAAFKPTPSIAKAQKSVNLNTMQQEKLTVTGRHDPGIVPRAVPVMEAAAAIAIFDMIQGEPTWN